MITFIQMPTIPYNWMIQRPQQIMKELNRRNNLVYYIENLTGNYLLKKNNNFYVSGRNFDIKNIKTRGNIVLWCSSPKQVELVDIIPHDYVIYDIIDEASHEFIGWRQSIKKMISKADIIFTSSENLYNKYKNLYVKTYLIKNGVDSEHFTLNKSKWPKDLPTGKKIIGYSGAIASWLDWNIINYISKDSNYNFVFIGALINQIRDLILRDNIYFLGLKQYREVPFYINNFDCCLIPFKLNSMTNCCNPIKLYEYFALGKPAVCTNMYGIKEFNNICYIAKSKLEFRKKIYNAVDENDNKLFNMRIEIAKKNSWKDRVDTILNILYEEFGIR
ncbi:glycosyltransferase [Clostridium ganghwense]|uniref:Glycosyltransferase n=1 Tax=Clostridium ganghwense TaxID=312089 RepID=A0ABT4CPZ7_9CLOT|nr:glycosyltransferase [Clostridium ganghwense]MCY6370528.1 glycosyltransferase [Clostridium ganghwense]